MKLELKQANISPSSLVKMTNYKKKSSIIVLAPGFKKYIEEKGITFISTPDFANDGVNNIQDLQNYKYFFIVCKPSYTSEMIAEFITKINQKAEVVFFAHFDRMHDHEYLEEYFPERFI